MRSIVQAAAAVAALPLLVAACSSAASSTSPTSTAATSSSVSPSASSPGNQAEGPLASLTANQIATKATADFKAATSMHVVGTMSADGTSEKLDLTIAPGKCADTMSTSSGPATLIEIGDTLYIKAGSEYIKSTDKNSQYQGMTGFCSVATFAEDLNVGWGSKGAVSTVDGQQVLRINEPSGSAYVSLSATPEFVRVNILGEQLDFSGYNAPVSITPPPASEVISG